jgi:RHS repeat-associated protein
VKKDNGKLYWYCPDGEVNSESDLAGVWIIEHMYFNGKRVARRELVPAYSLRYHFSDHMGSASVVTNVTETVKDESDYYPFGGERVITNSESNQYKFTGKERDTETGLDYFIARTYSSNLGRFLQPDEFKGGPVNAFSSNDPLPERPPLPYADITDPRSLNKYSYTYNDPLNHVDPDGHDLKALWDGLKTYFRMLLQPLNDAKASAKGGDATPSGNQGISESSLDGQEVVRKHAEALGQGIDVTSDLLLLADESGLGTAAKATMKGDARGAALASIAVIGPYPQYLKLANTLNAKRFSIPMKVWNRMSDAERWAANKKFLDRQIANKTTFALATHIDDVDDASTLSKEIDYLLKNGYEVSEDGWSLIFVGQKP